MALSRFDGVAKKVVVAAEGGMSQVDDRDNMLQDFVHSINMAGHKTSLPVVLQVGGFLISGDLIGGKEYFELLGNDLSSFIDNFSIRQIYKERGEKIYSDDEYKQDSAISYIHLKNAKFFHPDSKPMPDNIGFVWRCRLTAVHGFAIGRLAPV